MSRNMNWKSWVILGLAVAVLATSGTLVMASNMGFKINKVIYAGYVPTKAPAAVNWVSLPYSNPYVNAKALCNAMGVTTSVVTIYQLNPVTGAASVSFTCNLTTNQLLDAAKGVKITNTATTPTSVVLVGSSNETKTLPTILGGYVSSGAPKKENWISVPYHTTWRVAEDVCVSLGMGSSSGSVVRVNAAPPGAITTHPCGTTVTNYSLVIGEALDVRKTTVGDIVGKLPPHF